MLNPEQQQVRLRDAEIRRLKAENVGLANRVKEVQLAVVEMMRFLAKHLPVNVQKHVLTQAKEIEDSIKP